MLLIVLLISIVILVINLFYLCRDVRHPSNLYLSSWISMLLLYALPLVNYVEVSAHAYAYIILTLLIFNYSGILGSAMSISLPRFLARNAFIDNSPLVFLGFSGLLAALAYYQAKFGLINLIQNPGLVRSQDDGGSGLLGVLIFLPSIVFTIIVLQSSFKRKIGLSSIIFLISSLSYMLILPERTTLINTLVWTGISAFAINRRSQRLNLSLILRYVPRIFALLFIFIVFFIVVSERTGKIRYISQIDYALNKSIPLPNSIFEPYIYITANIPALSLSVDENLQSDQTLKLSPTLTTIFWQRAIQILIPNNKSTNLSANAEFVELPFRFNTYTWLYEPLKDFGFFGSLIYIAAFGITCGLTWQIRNKNISVFTCFLYGWAATACIFSILTNKFSSIYFNYSIIIVIALYIASDVFNRITFGKRIYQRSFYGDQK